TTDALNMKSVAGQMEEGELELKALLAGNNMLSFSQHIAQATQKIAEHAPADVIETSCAQVASLKEKAGLDMKSSMYPTTLKVPSSISLRSQLAAECLTLVKGPSQGVLSGSSDDLLAVLSVLKEMNKSRFAPAKPCPCMELMDISAVTYLKHALQDYHKVVIALHVPSQKPGDQFGLPKDLIAFVNELANAKEVYLYFFGNPYALKYFDQSAIKQIVLAYQNLPEFEMEASNHLNGLSATKGHLPVSSVNILG
ncbi:MAG: hypothetical protein KI790_18965, partial [Cyclobacteriaceae bacterium]|nr:hypothetical protein [Cyclobacteriaceae bacterium HetDA_MAG_MS6]